MGTRTAKRGARSPTGRSTLDDSAAQASISVQSAREWFEARHLTPPHRTILAEYRRWADPTWAADWPARVADFALELALADTTTGRDGKEKVARARADLVLQSFWARSGFEMVARRVDRDSDLRETIEQEFRRIEHARSRIGRLLNTWTGPTKQAFEAWGAAGADFRRTFAESSVGRTIRPRGGRGQNRVGPGAARARAIYVVAWVEHVTRKRTTPAVAALAEIVLGLARPCGVTAEERVEVAEWEARRDRWKKALRGSEMTRLSDFAPRT